MHNKFYGFSEEPFGLSPEPRFLFLTGAHIELLDGLVEGIKKRKGFLDSRPRGQGGREDDPDAPFASLMGQNIKLIPVYQNYQTIDEMLEFILQSLRLPLGRGNKGFMISQFEEYLIQKSALDQTPVMFIDDAQNLSREVLEELRLFAAPDPRKAKIPAGDLCGRSGSKESFLFRRICSIWLRGLRCGVCFGPLARTNPGSTWSTGSARLGAACRFSLRRRSLSSPKKAKESRGPSIAWVPLPVRGVHLVPEQDRHAHSREYFLPSQWGKTRARATPQGASAGSPSSREGAKETFLDRLAKSPQIMKVSYALLGYSLAIWIIFLFWSLQQG